MRNLFPSSLASPAGKLALSLLFAAHPIIPGTNAFNFPSISSPNLNLEPLGRVAFAGDFDSISLYQYEGQNERSSSGHGALLSRFPNGVFATLDETDADVKAMCPYERDGRVRIVFGGNFTSVGNKHTPGGIATIDPNDGTVEAMEGLNGSVNALHCDSKRGQVYVGGSFSGGNSRNAIVWKGGWNNMPFEGFNGPVHSIIEAPNGKIIFGGEFNGLGGNASAPAHNNTQVMPIGSANLTAPSSSRRDDLSDPKNIVCKVDPATEGPKSTWLLADDTPGFWRADFGFGFEPTKLRLHNTKFEGRGTKTWRYTALPDGGIMNFSYVDPSGQKSYCDALCPLPEGNTTAQDFTFVNQVGMNAFKIDISEWYGQGGGLNGIELFQNDIFSFAINEFNEPKCGGVTTGASASLTGSWQATPSHGSNSQYLTANLLGPIDPSLNTVVFQPDVKQSGNYTVTIYTPGCLGDDTCRSRGRVNITGTMTKNANKPISSEFWQTNNFDKYDEIYMGYVDATNGFRPSVTLAPMPGQNGPLTFVAQRVRFDLENASSGDLNGLFEYDTESQTVNNDFSKSVINSAGASLGPRDEATITTLAADSERLFVGGNFSTSDGRNNIFAIGRDARNPSSLTGNGLNSQVMTIHQNGSTIYVGGNFTNTQDNKTPGLNGIGAYSNNAWQPLGAGVNGVVMYIIPFSLNLTGNAAEEVLGISGFFDRVNQFDNNAAFSVENSAIWVPSQRNWLENLDLNAISMHGSLMTYTNIPGSDRLFAGSVSSQSLGASGAVALQYGNDMSLAAFPADMNDVGQQTSTRKRALVEGQNLTTTGVQVATFYKENDMNKTILGGHFRATGVDGQNITNLLIIDGKDGDKMSGFGDELDSNSTIAALGMLDNILYAGGAVTGRVNNVRIMGVVAYDLTSNRFTGTQPPALQGTNVTVNAIAPRPKSKDVFVAGRFQSAGPLTCPSLCVWNTERNQWNSPGGDISGTITSLTWISDTRLLIAGNITAGNNVTKILSYDSTNSQFQEIAGASDLPGPVTALTPATSDGAQIWAAGKASDGNAFLQRFDGNKWLPVNDLFSPGTTIRGIQVLTVTENHGQSELIDQGQDLLLLGQINITGFGGASGVLFNGTSLTPFLLSTTSDGRTGSLSQVFVENPQFFFSNPKKHLALGFIVLIALAIALALTFLLVVAGIVVEWYRKKAKGYSPAPTNYPDRMGNVGRLPPEQLFGSLAGNRPPAI
ncbi:cortical protein marker for cell polarity-domain-containing protein [Massariosphaeria phaeospora]|uniref:Cortical protein marker for cell polarity-domain-containing protein n=1 Tax=Massariosphaeria phaeospora TaxID=100035 RepID=A0A7C8MCP6_9PLEO|nr:cortical protein marker for cell polarity-domain-containing protein [Massariosphaeria phaeospora]